MSTQTKLTKLDWTQMEKRVSEKELVILNMIKHSFQGVQVIQLHQTISSLVKLDHDEKDYYIYTVLLKETVDQLSKKYKIDVEPLSKPKKKLNSADTIRLNSQQKKVSENIEMILLEMIQKLLKELSKPKKEYYFYNICHLYKIYKLNYYISQFVKTIIDKYSESMDMIHFLENTERFIETNNIFDYNPLQLYDHQKTLLSLFQDISTPKFVFYRAPTSSGKTLTPIGLCEKWRGSRARRPARRMCHTWRARPYQIWSAHPPSELARRGVGPCAAC
jgi:hypothetical protein